MSSNGDTTDAYVRVRPCIESLSASGHNVLERVEISVTTVEGEVRIDAGRGVYKTRRAAALAGVPVTTLSYWARNAILAPSIQASPYDRLWSWTDLLAARAIHWLRQGGRDADTFHPVDMRRIRAALAEIEAESLPRERLHDLALVSQHGSLFLQITESPPRQVGTGRLAMSGVLPLVRRYGARGPDLLQPRPCLRIIPGKLHGEPHLLNTRISSELIFALHQSGYTTGQILEMYPQADAPGIGDAVDLERSLLPPVAA
jgi:uncharacterized protein (DUF433 family)